MCKEIAKGLHCYSVEELRKGLEYQRQHYGWDFNSEREHMENLFCQRFNFLLIIYSLFVTAGASTSNQNTLTIVLLLGTVLTGLLSLTIWRAYVKLNINLVILYRLEKHPFEFIDKEVKSMDWKGSFKVNIIIGILIPVFCTISLASGTILSCLGIIKAA